LALAPLDDDAEACRWELARRYCHVFGPTTPSEFAVWAGIDREDAHATFERLRAELVEVRAERSAGWVLTESLALLTASDGVPGSTRVLPPGDAYLLARDRTLLVPERAYWSRLWPQGNVPPGGLLVDGELVGVWRRQGHAFTISSWRSIHSRQKDAVEAEIAAMPPLGANQPTVTWKAT
jgi:hypothetical protein